MDRECISKCRSVYKEPNSGTSGDNNYELNWMHRRGRSTSPSSTCRYNSAYSPGGDAQ